MKSVASPHPPLFHFSKKENKKQKIKTKNKTFHPRASSSVLFVVVVFFRRRRTKEEERKKKNERSLITLVSETLLFLCDSDDTDDES
jgi:hypothetical protein